MRCFNEIKALRSSDGEYCYNEEVLKFETIIFFKRLYIKYASSMRRFPIQNMLSILEPDLLDSIGRIPSYQKVYNALFDMAPLKALAVDRLHAQFYQSQWNIVGEPLVCMVKRVFKGANQTSFVGGRNIMDNVIIAQEVVHSMQHKKGKKGWMAIKIDMEKDYDKLIWEFIEDTLLDAQIPETLVHVIMQCATFASM
ncbi:hypothetical protein PVK06_043208 [Gossypium arboreum]|uniref:Reverse transcriptase domain-containing protein n=1 Tax=Gossypium arboreum TaxID=29729 RepID=A0ABR0MN41_GOSAR|nr:hypothetical protein PVK06_043208 [Gossypium arboreum]